MILRSYQIEARKAVRAALQTHRRVLLSAPVGAGKTCIAASMIEAASRKGRRSLFIVHRRELLNQARERLRSFGVDPGIILRDNHDVRVATVASVQTLVRRDPPPADLIFVDEAHRAVSPTFQTALAAYPDAWIVGLSATPYRLDGKGLSGTFDTLVSTITVSDLVRQGHLIAPTVYAPSTPDLSHVPKRSGDFATDALASATAPLTGDIVEHWHRLARDRITVAFCVNIEHARAVASQFNKSGACADAVWGSDPERERKLIDLRSGKLKILCSVDLLGEGWDLPELSCSILARPTLSLALHHQQLGRGMRVFPGKNSYIVLDHAGNHDRLGCIDDPITLSLDGVERVPVPRIITCRKCFAAYRVPPCPQCGTAPEPSQRDNEAVPETAEGELVRFTRTDRTSWYREAVLNASKRRHKLGTARHAYKGKFGVWPKHPEIDALYACPNHQPEEQHFGPRTVRRCAACLRG